MMKRALKPFLTLAVLAFLAVPAMAETAATPAAATAAVGAPAPAFSLSDENGTIHKLEDFRGKIVVLEWTNHECPYVKKHYDTGNMQKLQEQTTGNGVIWLSMLSSAPGMQGFTDAEGAKAVIEKTGAKATARLLDPDGAVGRLYGAKTTPHMFVIDKDGTLAYAGAIDDNPSANPATAADAKNYVSAALSALMEGRKPEVTQTAPYGCSVKYGNS